MSNEAGTQRKKKNSGTQKIPAKPKAATKPKCKRSGSHSMKVEAGADPTELIRRLRIGLGFHTMDDQLRHALLNKLLDLAVEKYLQLEYRESAEIL